MTKIGIAVLATVILFVFLMALRTWRRAMDHKRYLEQNMKASKASFAQAMAEHEKRTAGNLHKVPSPSKPEGMQLTGAERQAQQKMEEESRRLKDSDSSSAQSPSAWQTPDATTDT